jgi:hypothetical protein
MQRIRTIVMAAICGIPGPAIITALTLVAYGAFGHDWGVGISGFVQVAFAKIQRHFLQVIVESLLGMTYGAMRGFFEPPALSLLRGTILGAFIWLLIGFPFFMVIHPGSPPPSHAFGLYCEHVAAGAIAGMHVEYFLLRTRSKRHATNTPNERPT